MSYKETDNIWKALSDPTRRQILEFLRSGSRNTTEIVEHFPDLTRFNVMKHLDVLRSAELVLTEEEGRKRINSLNVKPISTIYDSWFSKFLDLGVERETGDKSNRRKKLQRISILKKKKDFGWKRYN